MGTLTVRPLMAGAAYTRMGGRVATTASLTAGLSVNDAVLDRFP